MISIHLLQSQERNLHLRSEKDGVGAIIINWVEINQLKQFIIYKETKMKRRIIQMSLKKDLKMKKILIR